MRRRGFLGVAGVAAVTPWPMLKVATRPLTIHEHYERVKWATRADYIIDRELVVRAPIKAFEIRTSATMDESGGSITVMRITDEDHLNSGPNIL